jgi:hypothetical protein
VREDRHREKHEDSPGDVRTVCPKHSAQRPRADAVGSPAGATFPPSAPEHQ